MYDPIVFPSILPKEIPVTLGTEQFVLKQATAGASTKYRDAFLRATKMDDGKLKGFDGMAATEIYLISMCLFRRFPNGDVLVSRDVIESWPGEVQKPLFEAIKRISPELADKDEEKPDPKS